MTDFERVIDFDNMYKAYRKAKCGKGFKKSAAKFNVNALDAINLLINQLKNKTYQICERKGNKRNNRYAKLEVDK